MNTKFDKDREKKIIHSFNFIIVYVTLFVNESVNRMYRSTYYDPGQFFGG